MFLFLFWRSSEGVKFSIAAEKSVLSRWEGILHLGQDVTNLKSIRKKNLKTYLHSRT